MSTGPAACICRAMRSDGLCWRGLQAAGTPDHCRQRDLPAWLVNLTMAGAPAEESALWARPAARGQSVWRALTDCQRSCRARLALVADDPLQTSAHLKSGHSEGLSDKPTWARSTLPLGQFAAVFCLIWR